MENVNFIENIAGNLSQNATVKNVYGEPISTNGKTIIPVAMVAFGFGGGYGQGKKRKPPFQDIENTTDPEKKESGEGQGAGGGGGMRAKPLGVYEITDGCTRFIPVNQSKRLLIAGVVGFLIHKCFFRKRK